MRSNTINVYLSSLNCSSLVKTSSKTTQSNYLRFLRQQQSTIFTFQETHTTDQTSPHITRQLQCNQALWTTHCGIVSFSNQFNLEQIPTNTDRIILAKVTHPHHFYPPFYLLTIYAPSGHTPPRRIFFNELRLQLLNYANGGLIDLGRLFITGDFNYSLSRLPLSTYTSTSWVEFLQHNFINTLEINGNHEIPTFQRPQGFSSTIDYIYAGLSFNSSVIDSNVLFLQPEWSDHSIITTQLNLGQSPLGPGLWRANPLYVNNEDFKHQLNSLLDRIIPATLSSDQTAQSLWDDTKQQIQRLVKSFGTKYVPWRQKTLKALQRRRNQLLKSRPSLAIRQMVLPPIDKMIHQLQQELTEIAGLKAGIYWREQSERSAGYLKKLHQQRQDQQYITALESEGVDGANNTESRDKESIAHDFYQQLYTSTLVHPTQIDQYLNNIRFPNQVSTTECQDLLDSITIDDIQEQANRMTRNSSPGEDGFGYPFWTLIFQHRSIHKLACQVYNEALLNGKVPTSWQQIRVRLLPKKGNLTSLKNWRPISLINCDAKIFTRLVTKRMAPILNRLINKHQAGFLPGRFIAEHGLALQLIMEQSQLDDHQGTGMLLDQEKAYDRVHPLYLENTMVAMGFPITFVKSITALFFKNKVKVNINGNFTATIEQQRGLRQGDPLSPLLFNIALEPFLLAINQDEAFQGYQIGSTTPTNITSIKYLAYADDVCVFLANQDDYRRLTTHIQQYTQVSNARFNIHKTEAFALNGKKQQLWEQTLLEHNITTYHHRHSPAPLRYLGFNLSYTDNQRRVTYDHLLDTVVQQIGIYSQRQLSIKGRVLVMNSLILSKVWYILRILVVPRYFFTRLQQHIGKYVSGGKHPRLSYQQMCQPVYNGGLGLLDPATHQRTMQLRWIRTILDPAKHDSFMAQLLIHHLSRFPAAASDPRQIMLFPEYRDGPLGEGYRSAKLWFQAMDALPIPLEFRNLTPATVCAIPLHRSIRLPPDHWLHQPSRHRLPGSSLFLYDHTLQSLRLKVPQEMHRPKYLMKRLHHDILARRIDLQPWVWALIGVAFDPLTTCNYDDTLVHWCGDPFWAGNTNKTIRAHLNFGSLPPYLFPRKTIKSFWSSPMFPHGRTVWYKVLTRKIPVHSLMATNHPQDP